MVPAGSRETQKPLRGLQDLGVNFFHIMHSNWEKNMEVACN
ncbi:hypothetical protein A33Q_4039 [Indibacter alkaliphilus LW1]|uniref:Uncharacterized protein n=1 Tax=Indibacter alkaliphilus (strain CCUG 57479 / KCTC 22604 / LW1) TaxID=1189612 RepID=S2DJ09_INDAL|nr:hypothetical protein A33Q_4039 [Indibacter alkaliphilus LW1]